MEERDIIKNVLFQFISEEELKNKGVKVLIDEYVLIPNVIGCISQDSKWYLYTTDERVNFNAKGPFSLNGIIKALALKLKVKTPDPYKFTEQERDTYIDTNYNDLSEIDNSRKQR